MRTSSLKGCQEAITVLSQFKLTSASKTLHHVVTTIVMHWCVPFSQGSKPAPKCMQRSPEVL